MNERLFRETARLLQQRGISFTAEEVALFCAGGEPTADPTPDQLANEIAEFVGEKQ